MSISVVRRPRRRVDHRQDAERLVPRPQRHEGEGGGIQPPPRVAHLLRRQGRLDQLRIEASRWTGSPVSSARPSDRGVVTGATGALVQVGVQVGQECRIAVGASQVGRLTVVAEDGDGGPVAQARDDQVQKLGDGLLGVQAADHLLADLGEEAQAAVVGLLEHGGRVDVGRGRDALLQGARGSPEQDVQLVADRDGRGLDPAGHRGVVPRQVTRFLDAPGVQQEAVEDRSAEVRAARSRGCGRRARGGTRPSSRAPDELTKQMVQPPSKTTHAVRQRVQRRCQEPGVECRVRAGIPHNVPRTSACGATRPDRRDITPAGSALPE